MALTKTVEKQSGPVSDATPLGTFEGMDEAPAAANEAPPAPAAAAPAAVTVAPAQAGAVAVSRGEASAFAKEVEAMKGAADFSYGNFPVFKGNNGEIIGTGDTKASFGRWVKVSMIAWDEHWEISPNSKNEKSRDYVAYSTDGQTLGHVISKEYATWIGKPITQYIEHLRNEMDYPLADSRPFVDVVCVVHESESNDAYNGEIVQITLSKTSIQSFKQYQEKLLQKARAVARGIPGVQVPADPFTFYFLRELASANGNNWTKLVVVDKLPPKL